MTHEPKYRWPLNSDQLEVLNLLYQFRFGTSDLIAKCFGKKSGVFVYKRLKILQEQGYIGKRFDSSYRIQGKPAAYYLLPAGLRKLNEHLVSEGKDELSVKGLYKSPKASDTLIQSCLSIFGLYCTLKEQYGDDLRFFTRGQLTKYDYFDEFTPIAYMRITFDGIEHDYFLEYLQSAKPFFAIIKRIKEYAEYGDSGEWEAGTDSEFPAILLVCDNQKLQNRLMKNSALALSEADDDLKFYITTSDKLDAWHNLADQDEEPLPLASI